MIQLSPLTLGYLLALVATVSWGLVVIPIKGSKISSALGIAISMPTGFFVLLAGMLLFDVDTSWTSKLSVYNCILLLGCGLFQFVIATFFYYESIKLAELSKVIPLTRLKAVFVALFVFILGIETITSKMVIACLIGIVGAIILTYHKGKSNKSTSKAKLEKGVLFILLTCISWAIGDILVREVIQDIPALPTTMISLLLGTVCYYIFLIFKKQIRPLIHTSFKEKARYMAHGLISFAIAYLTFFASIKYIGVTNAAIITASWPMISCILGFSFYGEKITMPKLIGITLLVGSVFLVIL